MINSSDKQREELPGEPVAPFALWQATVPLAVPQPPCPGRGGEGPGARQEPRSGAAGPGHARPAPGPQVRQGTGVGRAGSCWWGFLEGGKPGLLSDTAWGSHVSLGKGIAAHLSHSCIPEDPPLLGFGGT